MFASQRTNLIDAAADRGWVRASELPTIRGAMTRDPQLDAGHFLVARGFLTPQQLRELEDALGRTLVEDSLSGDDPNKTQVAPDVPASGARLEETSFPTIDVSGATEVGEPKPADFDCPEIGVTAGTPATLQSTIEFLLDDPADRYRLTKLHATGGIGRVWLAKDRSLKRNVALKDLLPERADNANVAERFLREAYITGQLEHPGVAPVYELGRRADRQPFYTMRFVNGKNLQAAIRTYHHSAVRGQENALGLRALLQALVQVCHTMAYAHSKGVVHRDLKPENVVLGSFGETVVLDWGLAKFIGSSAPESVADLALANSLEPGKTALGQVLGTPAYMAPEQADGRAESADERTDVYGLGAILYEILTNKPPFSGATSHECLDQVCKTPPKPPRQIVLHTPKGLEAVCLKALAKNPADRYQTAQDFVRDLENWLADEPVAALPEPWYERAGRTIRRRRALAGSVALSLVAVTLAATVATVFVNRERAIQATLAGEKSDLADRNANLLRLARRASAEAGENAEKEAAARRQAQLVASEMVFERGVALCESGHVTRGTLWFARSLELAPQDAPDWRRVLLGNIAGWKRRAPRLERILPHAANATAVQYLPGGERVLTGDQSGRLAIWNLATGTVERELPHRGAVNCLAVSPDGKLAAAGSADRSLRAWRLADGREAPAFKTDGVHPIDLALFTPDRKTLIAADEAGTVYRFDVETGASLGVHLNHGGQVLALDVSADSKLLASSSADGTARIWHIANGKLVGPPIKRDAWIYAVRFSPNGAHVAVGGDNGTIDLLDSVTLKPVCAPIRHGGPCRHVEFLAGGKQLVSGGADNLIRFWDAATGASLGPPETLDGAVQCLTVSHDDMLLAVGSSDNFVHLWDAKSRRRIGSPIEHQSAVFGVEFHPAKPELITLAGDRAVRVWKLDRLDADLLAISHGGSLTTCDYSPAAKQFATGGDDRRIRTWDAAGGRKLAEADAQGHVFDVRFDPLGQRLASSASDAWVRFWNVSSLTPQKLAIVHPGPCEALAFSPDGALLATGCWNRIAQVFETRSGVRLYGEIAHRGGVGAVEFAPDGGRIATGTQEGDAALWDAKTGKPIGVAMKHPARIADAAFSPDGKHLATACNDRRIRVWNAATGALESAAIMHQSGVRRVAYSADGQLLISGGNDRAARLWDVATGKPIGPPIMHAGAVMAVGFRGDGAIYSAGREGQVRVVALPGDLPDEPKRLQLWLETDFGAALDSAGGLQILDAAQLAARQTQLRMEGGALGK